MVVEYEILSETERTFGESDRLRVKTVRLRDGPKADDEHFVLIFRTQLATSHRKEHDSDPFLMPDRVDMRAWLAEQLLPRDLRWMHGEHDASLVLEALDYHIACLRTLPPEHDPTNARATIPHLERLHAALAHLTQEASLSNH